MTRDWKPAQNWKLDVVVADDDREILRRISAALRRDGCHVTTARDGSELLRVLADSEVEDRRPDILIAAAHIPCYPGASVLVSLRNAGWDTPVILMTDAGDGAVERLAREKHAQSVPHRPIDVNRLCDIVRRETHVP